MKKNNIYLATKLFSFYDRYASTNMYNAISRSKKYNDEDTKIYLPFRDSNMKVSNIGNVSKNIFDADINSLKNSNIFICRIDGLSFDAGIGFELGYCLGSGCLLYVFSTDFIRAKIFERKFIITNIVDKIANSFYYEYKNIDNFSYEDSLKDNFNGFTNFVTNKIDKYDLKFKNKYINNKQYDIFIDFCGQKYQWNELILNSITTELEKYGVTYWVSDRYKTDYNFEKDISALDNCKIYLTCFDENEPDFDSCILQGYAYYKNKYIVGCESNNITYYVEGGQTMRVNLMVEQSCNTILKSYTEIVNKIMELKNEKEK